MAYYANENTEIISSNLGTSANPANLANNLNNLVKVQVIIKPMVIVAVQ